jgi:hypothetical protein
VYFLKVIEFLTEQVDRVPSFPLKFPSPSDDGHHWPKHIKAIVYYLKVIVLFDGI